jgi:hypothetical protein
VKRPFAALWFLLAGCTVSRPLGLPALETSMNGNEHSAQPSSLLTRALAPIAQAVLAEGYHTSGPIEHGFLAPSARVVQPFVLAPRTCVAIVAIATATVTDLDTAIYGADGSALAEDDTTGARPIVRLCTGEQRLEAYLAFYAFQGTGSFAAQRLERALAPADELLLREVERENRGSVATDDTPGFSELLRGLHGHGYEDDGPITELPLAHGSALRLATHVDAGRCYGAVADGQGIMVRLLDKVGREVALGVGATGPAALQYCAREDADLLLELSTQGAGRTARLARLHAGQAAVGSARAVWLGEPSPAFALGARNARESGAYARCQGKALPVLSAAPLAQGALIEQELKLSGCTLLAGELREGLAVVTLRIEDGAGATIAERDLLTPHDSLRVCATQPGSYRLTVIGRAGFGALSLARQACGD